jgi:hypothetical protein
MTSASLSWSFETLFDYRSVSLVNTWTDNGRLFLMHMNAVDFAWMPTARCHQSKPHHDSIEMPINNEQDLARAVAQVDELIESIQNYCGRDNRPDAKVKFPRGVMRSADTYRARFRDYLDKDKKSDCACSFMFLDVLWWLSARTDISSVGKQMVLKSAIVTLSWNTGIQLEYGDTIPIPPILITRRSYFSRSNCSTPALFDLRPGARLATGRPSKRSRSAFPSGRPLPSDERSARKASSSKSVSSNAAKWFTRFSTGTTETSSSSLLAKCARTLDHSQSSALRAKRARTGLRLT